jgi:hypothetical protein
MTPEFEKDKNGDIITKPVVGFTTAPVAGMAVLLAIRYVETPEELESGGSKQIQLILTPQQAQEIANSLARQGERILGNPPSPRESKN